MAAMGCDLARPLVLGLLCAVLWSGVARGEHGLEPDEQDYPLRPAQRNKAPSHGPILAAVSRMLQPRSGVRAVTAVAASRRQLQDGGSGLSMKLGEPGGNQLSTGPGSEGAGTGIGIGDTSTLEPCDDKWTDYTPCEDPTRANSLPRAGMQHRERHCPSREEIQRMRCLIPPPVGYKYPLPWPQSRDEAWYVNVPHKHLTTAKADQNWIRYDEQTERFAFPGGGTMFHHGADKYLERLNELLPINVSAAATWVRQHPHRTGHWLRSDQPPLLMLSAVQPKTSCFGSGDSPGTHLKLPGRSFHVMGDAGWQFWRLHAEQGRADHVDCTARRSRSPGAIRSRAGPACHAGGAGIPPPPLPCTCIRPCALFAVPDSVAHQRWVLLALLWKSLFERNTHLIRFGCPFKLSPLPFCWLVAEELDSIQ